MIISLIAAHTQNRVIGKENQLPWHLPDDMRYFMETTMGHVVVMGRKNYDSIPAKYRPLPNRQNIVVTRQLNWTAPGLVVKNSLNDALAWAKQNGEQEVFVIGGADVYAQALPLAHRLYLTEIQTTMAGDRYFPEWDRAAWKEQARVPHVADERHPYAFDFVVYHKLIN